MTGPDVSDVMSEEVFGICKEATVKEAASEMKKKDVRGLVVVEDGEVIGIVAGKDILYKVVSEGLDTSETKVEDVMTKDVVVCFDTDTVYEVAVKMIKHDISRVPIVSTGGDVVGIITQTDLLHTWPGYVDLLEERATDRLG